MTSVDKDNFFKSYQLFDNEYKDLWWENANQPDSHTYSDHYFHSSALERDDDVCEEHIPYAKMGGFICRDCGVEVDSYGKEIK